MPSKADNIQQFTEHSAIIEELEDTCTYPLPLTSGLRNLLIIFTFSTVMIVFGITTIGFNGGIVEHLVPYPKDCTYGDVCTAISLPITTTMTAPIYVYYGLTKTFQSHRRWIMSSSFTQLYGKSNSDVSLCDPVTKSPDGKNYTPCGLRGYSFFNDVIALGGAVIDNSVGDVTVETGDVLRKGIALPTDTNNKELKLTDDDTSRYIKANGQKRDDFDMPPILSDQYLIWMRPATSSTFYKLYAKITKTLNPGDELTFTITEKYPATSYGGEKSLVVTTASAIGGKNMVLSVCLLAFGSLGYIGIIGIVITHVATKPILVREIMEGKHDN